MRYIALDKELPSIRTREQELEEAVRELCYRFSETVYMGQKYYRGTIHPDLLEKYRVLADRV